MTSVIQPNPISLSGTNKLYVPDVIEKFPCLNITYDSREENDAVEEIKTGQYSDNEVTFILQTSFAYFINELEILTAGYSQVLVLNLIRRKNFLFGLAKHIPLARTYLTSHVLSAIEDAFSLYVNSNSEFLQRHLLQGCIENLVTHLRSVYESWNLLPDVKEYVKQKHKSVGLYHSFLIPNNFRHIYHFIKKENEKIIEKMEEKCRCTFYLSNRPPINFCGFQVMEILFDVFHGNFLGCMDMLEQMVYGVSKSHYFIKHWKSIIKSSDGQFIIFHRSKYMFPWKGDEVVDGLTEEYVNPAVNNFDNLQKRRSHSEGREMKPHREEIESNYWKEDHPALQIIKKNISKQNYAEYKADVEKDLYRGLRTKHKSGSRSSSLSSTVSAKRKEREKRSKINESLSAESFLSHDSGETGEAGETKKSKKKKRSKKESRLKLLTSESSGGEERKSRKDGSKSRKKSSQYDEDGKKKKKKKSKSKQSSSRSRSMMSSTSSADYSEGRKSRKKSKKKSRRLDSQSSEDIDGKERKKSRKSRKGSKRSRSYDDDDGERKKRKKSRKSKSSRYGSESDGRSMISGGSRSYDEDTGERKKRKKSRKSKSSRYGSESDGRSLTLGGSRRSRSYDDDDGERKKRKKSRKSKSSRYEGDEDGARKSGWSKSSRYDDTERGRSPSKRSKSGRSKSGRENADGPDQNYFEEFEFTKSDERQTDGSKKQKKFLLTGGIYDPTPNLKRTIRRLQTNTDVNEYVALLKEAKWRLMPLYDAVDKLSLPSVFKKVSENTDGKARREISEILHRLLFQTAFDLCLAGVSPNPDVQNNILQHTDMLLKCLPLYDDNDELFRTYKIQERLADISAYLLIRGRLDEIKDECSMLSKNLLLIEQKLFGKSCVSTRKNILNRSDTKVLYHSFFVGINTNLIEPFLREADDRRVSKIERTCHCRIVHSKKVPIIMDVGYHMIEIYYDFDFGNHFGCIDMLESMLKAAGESCRKEVRSYRTIVCFPSGERLVMQDLSWMLKSYPLSAPDKDICPRLKRWYDRMGIPFEYDLHIVRPSTMPRIYTAGEVINSGEKEERRCSSAPPGI